jgi:hypothetical protein
MTVARYLSSFVNFLTSAGVINPTGGGTGNSSYTKGDILYASGTNTLSKLAIGSTGQVLSVSSGLPAWTAAPTNATRVVLSGSGNWDPTSVTGTFVLVRMWGGGGAGRKSNSGTNAGGGGGGIYVERYYSLSAFGSTLQPYSVATGGAGVTTQANGNPGGSSTFGTGVNAFTAYGGNGGTTGGADAGGFFATGGAGLSTGTSATIPNFGGAGGNQTLNAGNGYYGGGGGGGAAGTGGTTTSAGTSLTGGAGGAAGSSVSGTAGSTPGGGGGATVAGTISGAGGDGRIELWVW